MKKLTQEYEKLYQEWLHDGAEYWANNPNAKSGIKRTMRGVTGMITSALQFLIMPYVELWYGKAKSTITFLYGMIMSDPELAITNFQKWRYYGEVYKATTMLRHICYFMINLRLFHEGLHPRTRYMYEMMYRTEWQEYFKFHLENYEFLEDILDLRKTIQDCEERVEECNSMVTYMKEQYFHDYREMEEAAA